MPTDARGPATPDRDPLQEGSAPPPGPTGPGGPEARARLDALRAEVDGLMAGYEAAQRRISATYRQVRQLTGRARSADRLASVTVGPRGQVTVIELDPQVYRRYDPPRLAALLVELAGKAAGEVTGQVEELLGALLPPGVPVRPLLAGEVDPAALGAHTGPTQAEFGEWWASVTQLPTPGSDRPPPSRRPGRPAGDRRH